MRLVPSLALFIGAQESGRSFVGPRTSALWVSRSILDHATAVVDEAVSSASDVSGAASGLGYRYEQKAYGISSSSWSL
jgi:hypothetical protein